MKKLLFIVGTIFTLTSTGWGFWFFGRTEDDQVLDDSTEGLSESAVAPTTGDSKPYLESIEGERSLTGERPWRAPNYTEQPEAIGYAPDTFKVPVELQRNFDFWTNIYAKYSSENGLIHDAENLDVIYEIVDFSSISKNETLDAVHKQLARERLVKARKKFYTGLLRNLSKVKDGTDLSGEEKRVWDLWAASEAPQKIAEAASPKKLRFQLGQKDRIVQGIYYSGRYIEEIEAIFRDAGVPVELTRLIFVESSFNVLARSKVGASGLWQIMPVTAKPYMRTNASVDKRNDPLEATKVAAKILKANYQLLKAWPLAVTGWNHGPNGLAKLIRAYGTNDIGELVRNVKSRKSFGFASRNFYSAFLAILAVEREADKHYGNPTWSNPLGAEKVKLSRSIGYRELVRWCDGDQLKTDIFNPHISFASRKRGLAIPAGSTIQVPSANLEQARSDLANNKKKNAAQAQRLVYVVARGDTASSIARSFGIRREELIAANELRSADQLRRGQKLIVPINTIDNEQRFKSGSRGP